jgi:hypothetical protein
MALPGPFGGIRRIGIFVFGEPYTAFSVKKQLQISETQSINRIAEKYYEKGRFFLKFGTAFG